MVKIIKLLFLILFAFGFSLSYAADSTVINLVVAENVYGQVAKELGGNYVNVINILNNPAEDPHLFNITPSAAKLAADADIIIYNGADYDPWMKSLLAIKSTKQRSVIVIAELMGTKTGANPHLWYLPQTLPLFAQRLVALLSQYAPQHKNEFEQKLAQFNRDDQAIFELIEQLKTKYKNTPVIATEPLFNYLASAIGLTMHGNDFQIKIMNDVPPTISQIKQFEADLRTHAVRVLIYNSQVANPTTARMLLIAKNADIPIVGMSEMLPPNITYIQWMMNQLKELEKALAKASGH